MHQDITTIKRALMSVSNKTGIVELAKRLFAMGVEIVSTGGTSEHLKKAGITVKDVADLTGFPEMMDGRLKTLHPRVHGGILGQRDQHADVAKAHDIQWIDLVVVNLYPFAETIKKQGVTFDEAVENIDVGGPTMIRAAGKNMGWATVMVDPYDYSVLMDELEKANGVSFETRRRLAIKAFGHTAHYDQVIENYFLNKETAFPEKISFFLKKEDDLRYGENPHQAAALYQWGDERCGVLSATQKQGKPLSYNNIMDADAAVACVSEFEQPACVVVKHANPCGVAVDQDIATAFNRAFQVDALSAFGGVVALNQPCDKAIAEFIVTVFMEVLIAPHFSADALSVLSAKPNLRALEWPIVKREKSIEWRCIEGGFLAQERDAAVLQSDKLRVVTKTQPSANDSATMLMAWSALRHVKSNAIVIAKEGVTVGIGPGQVSRVDAVDTALKKAGDRTQGAILASDAFFPFRDSIDRLKGAGIRAVIQPGGSMRDQEVIDACNELGIAMVFTNIRCFKH